MQNLGASPFASEPRTNDIRPWDSISAFLLVGGYGKTTSAHQHFYGKWCFRDEWVNTWFTQRKKICQALTTFAMVVVGGGCCETALCLNLFLENCQGDKNTSIFVWCMTQAGINLMWWLGEQATWNLSCCWETYLCSRISKIIIVKFVTTNFDVDSESRQKMVCCTYLNN